MYVSKVLKVLYAPSKTFKEIIKDPRYIGPIVIMVLFLLANVAFGYTLLSKSYIDQTMPRAVDLATLSPADLDLWTENVTFWSSNANISLNTQDYINGTYYGNRSIEFSSISNSRIWLQLNTSSSSNCSGASGYKNLSFRMKWIALSANPSNASLYLFSTSPQDDFYQTLDNELNQTGVWENLTISLGPESEGWNHNANADWGNINGLRLEFTWPADTNTTLLVDGLFFHGLYEPQIEIEGTNLLGYSISAVMQFAVQWVAFGGLLYIILRMTKTKTTSKLLVTIGGFALITLVIQILANTAFVAVSPPLKYSLKVLGGVPGEWENAYAQAVGSLTQVLWYIEKVIYVWTIALCAIALHSMPEFSWTKSIIVSTVSFVISLLVMRFLIYGAIWL